MTTKLISTQAPHFPVVVVIATCGKDRVRLLLDRALASVRKQTLVCDRIVVVSDNDIDDNLISEEEVKACFPKKDQYKVYLLQNKRTTGCSGTGAWNTGIQTAFGWYGENCWVAILDDDDYWKDDHVQECLDAASKVGVSDCQWVVSGIIRRSNSSGEFKDSFEPIPCMKPSAKDFFTTNPGVQGSNLFVRCGLLQRSGMFDEKLPSTTDRDLCIRLSDDLFNKDGSFASTGKYTVVHYADQNIRRVSTSGSPMKIQGLQRFFLKHAPRMDEEQRESFKARAKKLFGCGGEMFQSQTAAKKKTPCQQNLQSWSGDYLPLNKDTQLMLPALKIDSDCIEKDDVMFGIISGDIRRLENLLKDISEASRSSKTCFQAYVVIFSNIVKPDLVYNTMKKYDIRGYVLEQSDEIVSFILGDGIRGSLNSPLPICQSRTVLQVYLYILSKHLDDITAIVILDDDKRLPLGWTPLPVEHETANINDTPDIQIGRDCRTPPNPSLMSIRTNLMDFLYAIDRQQMSGRDSNDVENFINGLSVYTNTCIGTKSDKFDFYYDMSSSRYDHLEMPFCSDEIFPESSIFKDMDVLGKWLDSCLSAMLVGTPLFRDVIPLESGLTTQRGGCMVVRNKNEKSFDVLAIEQDAPELMPTGSQSLRSRRSDSIWCNFHKNRGKSIKVIEQLYVYHDNTFDKVPSPFKMRRIIVQEICGGILCRCTEERQAYAKQRIVDLKSWMLRVQGLIQAFRSRAYCSNTMVRHLIRPLEEIFDSQKWEEEVYSVIKNIELRDFKPNPIDFSKSIQKIHLSDIEAINFEWKKPRRILKAREIIEKEIGKDAFFVGIGQEGVVFRINSDAYKLFDQVEKHDLPTEKEVEKFDASYVECRCASIILKRPFIVGETYRGKHGPAIVCLLRTMKKNYLYSSNFSPNNIIVEKDTGKLHLIDVGRDTYTGKRGYDKKFADMCKRAFLCYRFGSYTDNTYQKVKLREWMRESLCKPQFIGFENFMSIINGNEMIDQCDLLMNSGDITDKPAIKKEQKLNLKYVEVQKTKLPVKIVHGALVQIMSTDLYVSKWEMEGDLKIQIVALVKSKNIEHAENVSVRVHSECLTGDVLNSCKCDCGEQKQKFMRYMHQTENSVFVYIKGHEGRGAGLHKKIQAYSILEQKDNIKYTHIDALHEIGCNSDIRKYDAAFYFLREKLKIKSIKLWTNNPQKYKTACQHFSGCCSQEVMPTIPTDANFSYLKEKEELCGHKGLIGTER